jgi:hypothetical protein
MLVRQQTKAFAEMAGPAGTVLAVAVFQNVEEEGAEVQLR